MPVHENPIKILALLQKKIPHISLLGFAMPIRIFYAQLSALKFFYCLLAKLTMGLISYCTVMSCLFHSVLKWIWIKSQRDWCPKFATDKWPFSKHLLPSFWHLHEYLYKTEVQMVILRCWTGLNFNWFKSYDKKCKHFHFQFFAILYTNTHLHLLHFCVLCHNFSNN